MHTDTVAPTTVDIPMPVASASGVIHVTEAAAAKIQELLAEEGKAESGLRVFVQGGGCSGFQYGLMIEENGAGVGDQLFESNGVKLFIDPVSLSYLKGAEVDFVDTITGGGFTIKNPNATSTCGCGSSFSA
jgi:iron-sulfur cluster assembly accessory protein